MGADHAFHAQAISRTQYGQHAVTVGRHERVQVIHHSEDATSTWGIFLHHTEIELQIFLNSLNAYLSKLPWKFPGALLNFHDSDVTLSIPASQIIGDSRVY